MKRFSLIALSILAVVSLVACGDDKEEEDKVVATVNDEEIMESEWQTNVDQMKMQYEQYYSQMGQELDFESEEGKQMLAQIEQQALDSMIQQEVLVQKAEEEGYESSEEDVDKEMDAMVEQYGSEEELDKVLEENGLDKESYEDLLEEQLVIESFIDEEVEIDVSDEEIDDAYADYEKQTEEQDGEVEDKEDVEEDLIKQVEQQKEQEAVQELTEEAEEEYDIERNLDEDEEE